MFRYVACALALCAIAGCQRYSPRPLDSAAHRAEWASRSPEAESIREFAARLGVPPPSNSAEGLTLADAELVALVFNPELRRARAKAAVGLANSEYAGLWADPALSIDILRVTESIPDPWVIGGAVAFTLPLSGRLPVERALASAEYESHLRWVAETEWATIATLRSTWAEWSAVRLHAELVRELIVRVDAIVSVVDRLEQGQAISRLEGRLFRMERASRRSELVLLDARADQLEMELKSLMGLMPEAPVSLIPHIAALPAPPTDDAFALLEQRSPELARKRAEYEIAEQALHLEIRKQYPDLQIGPAYEWDEGQNKIGLGAGVTLPLLNANRQGIAVARAKRDASRAEYEASTETLMNAYRQALRQHEATVAARSAIEQDLLPLAEAQIADERRMAELGELNVLLTLESVVRAHDTKVQLISARLAEAQASVRLHALVGPETRVPAAPATENQR